MLRIAVIARLNNRNLISIKNPKNLIQNRHPSVLFSSSPKCEKIDINEFVKTKKKFTKASPINLSSVREKQGQSDGNESEGDQNFEPISLVLLAIPIATFCFGIWQVQRRQWKLGVIKLLEERTQAEPREIPTDPKELEKLTENYEYSRFKAKGYFIHSKEILISPKPDLTETIRLTGAYVITPFMLSDRPNLTILVNRGFVPYYQFSPMTRQEGQIDGEVEIVGILRDNEVKGTFTPDNKPPAEWHNRDINEMARELNTAPLFIDAVESTTVKGGPLGGQTSINLRNEHLSYIVTWFSLSAITTFLWVRHFGVKLFKK